jgi:hypothetical protein
LFWALGAASGFEARADQTPGTARQNQADGAVGTPVGAAGTGEEKKSPPPEAPAGEPRQDPHATKFEATIRLGFSLPFGTVTGSVGGSDYFDFTALNELTLYTFSVGADFGVRIAGVVFVGGYFQYAVGAPNSTYGSSSSSDVRLGVEILVHPLGIVAVDPWVGLGAGYEWFDVSPLSADNAYASAQFKGWELLNVQAGVDFALGSAVKLGPYVAFSIGQFDSFSGNRGTTDSFPLTDKTLHEWLTFGVRLVILP